MERKRNIYITVSQYVRIKSKGKFLLHSKSSWSQSKANKIEKIIISVEKQKYFTKGEYL